MTGAPTNPLKAMLAAGAVTRGFWLNMMSDTATEIAGHSGADWCLIDAEHAPFDPTRILALLRILAGTPAAAIVRVPVAEDWVLKQVLDLGAQSILVPMVHSAEAARAVVSACRYPPRGVRGMGPGVSRAGLFGRRPDYVRTAEPELCLLVQAESGAALDALEEIAAVDGVDGILIGPADLAADTGAAPEALEQIVHDAIGRIAATGKVAGIYADAQSAARYQAMGARLISIGSDGVLFSDALQEALA